MDTGSPPGLPGASLQYVLALVSLTALVGGRAAIRRFPLSPSPGYLLRFVASLDAEASPSPTTLRPGADAPMPKRPG